MKTGVGIPIFPGVAIGPAVVYRRPGRVLPPSSGDPAEEQKKFDAARVLARRQLQLLYEKANAELGTDKAAIVEVQQMMLEDPEYLYGAAASIASGAAAAAAALDTGEAIAREFAAMEDPYMKARAADIRDMSRRVCDILCGREGFRLPPGAFVLVAEDLSPSETLQLPGEQILAVVTRQGSSFSHAAILARTRNIPSLVQAEIDLKEAEGCRTMAVDGSTGAWYLDPDGETLAWLREKQALAAGAKHALEIYRGRQSITKSGKRVILAANIGSPEDARAAAAADAEAIGLMRSEFLYLGRRTPPTEQEQFEAYRQVARIMEGRPVVIRTLDMGGDKQMDCLGLEPEENPALGLRGLRFCLVHREIFRPQLRAIYRAAACGDVRILFPMVSSLQELQRAKALCAEVRAELAGEGTETREIPIGIMVETPAAAILAEELAREADFFSVGTNDLTQYLLAADRQNPRLREFYDPYHPALMALMAHVADAARKAGIPAGVCGELAADPVLQETFIKMGYTELSMAPGRILATRALVCRSEV